MRKITLLLILVMLLSSKAYAKEVTDLNGNDWNDYRLAEKHSMVAGFMLAVTYIIDTSKNGLAFEGVGTDRNYSLFGTLVDNKAKKYTKDEVKKLLNSKNVSMDETMESYRIFNISNGQITTGLDEFYKDFKNIQIKVSDALYYVRKQISGSDQDELDATINYLRSPDRTFKKRFYTDKSGERRFLSVP